MKKIIFFIFIITVTSCLFALDGLENIDFTQDKETIIGTIAHHLAMGYITDIGYKETWNTFDIESITMNLAERISPSTNWLHDKGLEVKDLSFITQIAASQVQFFCLGYGLSRAYGYDE